jgi:hypothetical protein
MKTTSLRGVVLAGLASMALVGCGPDSEASWAEVEDGVELVQGELTVSAVLGFLNGPDATEAVLDGDVGLDARAARNIVAHVRGPDGVLGTGDDDLLQSIAELDAIAYVGDAAIAAIDRYATPRYGTQDTLVEGVRFSADEAALVVAVCNDARLEDTRLTNLQKLKLREARPLASLAAVAATYGIGRVALATLHDFAAAQLGPTPPPPTGGCTDTGGVRDGVAFTAAEACKAVEFLNTARTSDMWRLPATSLDFVYFGGPNRPLGPTQRSRWSRLNEFTDAAGVGAATVTGLRESLSGWTPGGPTTDTVADVWTRRASLKDKPVRLDRVYVTRVLPRTVHPTQPWVAFNCGEVRDGPSAPNFLVACWTMVNADSASGCQVDDCFAGTVGTWVHARGLFTTSSNRSTGGYVVSLINAPFKPAAP